MSKLGSSVFLLQCRVVLFVSSPHARLVAASPDSQGNERRGRQLLPAGRLVTFEYSPSTSIFKLFTLRTHWPPAAGSVGALCAVNIAVGLLVDAMHLVLCSVALACVLGSHGIRTSCSTPLCQPPRSASQTWLASGYHPPFHPRLRCRMLRISVVLPFQLFPLSQS